MRSSLGLIIFSELLLANKVIFEKRNAIVASAGIWLVEPDGGRNWGVSVTWGGVRVSDQRREGRGGDVLNGL